MTKGKCSKGKSKTAGGKCKFHKKVARKISAAINKGTLSKDFPTGKGTVKKVAGKGAISSCKSTWKPVANRVNIDTICKIKLKKK